MSDQDTSKFAYISISISYQFNVKLILEQIPKSTSMHISPDHLIMTWSNSVYNAPIGGATDCLCVWEYHTIRPLLRKSSNVRFRKYI